MIYANFTRNVVWYINFNGVGGNEVGNMFVTKDFI